MNDQWPVFVTTSSHRHIVCRDNENARFTEHADDDISTNRDVTHVTIPCHHQTCNSPNSNNSGKEVAKPFGTPSVFVSGLLDDTWDLESVPRPAACPAVHLQPPSTICCLSASSGHSWLFGLLGNLGVNRHPIPSSTPPLSRVIRLASFPVRISHFSFRRREP